MKLNNKYLSRNRDFENKPLLLQHLTWPEVESYLNISKKILFPVGSTEQHGPNGIIGIDYLSTEKICEEVSRREKIISTPALPFGMAVHHMEFPGTMTLTPLNYTTVLTELLKSLLTQGFEEIFVVNGHGGNIAPLTTAFCELKQKNETCKLKLLNWWHLPEVTQYEEKHFGELNGFHATCGEISLTRFTNQEAYDQIEFHELELSNERTHWPMSPKEFRTHFPIGVMGSKPMLSSVEHGKEIFERAVQSICKTTRNKILD